MERVLLRALTLDDVPALDSMAERAGRNLHARDLSRFLALEGAHGLAATRDGGLVGAITAIRYFEHGFLGPLLLPEGDGSVGLAVALTVAGVEGLQRRGVAIIEAEAGDVEAPILERMGFATLRRTLVMERPAGGARLAPRTVPLGRAHLVDLGALDAAAVGWGRKELLLALRDAFPEGARAVEGPEGLRGFVLVREARRGHQLGPLVTQPGDADAARLLIADAVSAAPDSRMVALVPDAGELEAPMLDAGFARVGELRRMRAGGGAAPGGAATEWVIGTRLTG